MFKEKVNARTDARTHGRTTDNGPWHKLAGLRPVELKTNNSNLRCLQILSNIYAANVFKVDKPKFCAAANAFHLIEFFLKR